MDKKRENEKMKVSCQLFLADCLEKLKEIPDNNIDLVLTDPPYGLEFMGKSWDKWQDSFNEKWASAVYPKMKDGSFLVFTMTPRQDLLWRCLAGLEKAGFNLNFSSCFWLYHSGFPKASDISKSIDRKGESCQQYSELSKELCNYLKQARETKKLSQKEIAKHFLSKTGGLTGCYWNWENGANIPTMEQWEKLKGLLELRNEKFNELIERAILKRIEAEREIIGKDSRTAKESMFNIGIGEWEKSLPINELSKKWFGWKSCSLKPAVEMIIVAQKPRTEKTIVEQVLQNGCGAVNIEECRIPYANESDREGTVWDGLQGFGNSQNDYGEGLAPEHFEGKNNGRFPSNLMVSENPLKGESYLQGGNGNYTGYENKTENATFSFGENAIERSRVIADGSNNPNRFYDLDRWAEKRNITLAETLEGDLSAFFDVPKPASSEKEESLEEVYTEKAGRLVLRQNEPRKGNPHPTVKPILLFSYLAKLFCQPNGLILDPFMGSGTTGIAALKQGFSFIGIEKEPDYFKIAEARIKPLLQQQRLVP
jgi:site-specific DNA-methyltransferase (adenine-specific)